MLLLLLLLLLAATTRPVCRCSSGAHAVAQEPHSQTLDKQTRKRLRLFLAAALLIVLSHLTTPD